MPIPIYRVRNNVSLLATGLTFRITSAGFNPRSVSSRSTVLTALSMSKGHNDWNS